MKTSMYKFILLAGVVFFTSLALTSCDKNDTVNTVVPGANSPVTYIYDRDLPVSMACISVSMVLIQVLMVLPIVLMTFLA